MRPLPIVIAALLLTVPLVAVDAASSRTEVREYLAPGPNTGLVPVFSSYYAAAGMCLPENSYTVNPIDCAEVGGVLNVTTEDGETSVDVVVRESATGSLVTGYLCQDMNGDLQCDPFGGVDLFVPMCTGEVTGQAITGGVPLIVFVPMAGTRTSFCPSLHQAVGPGTVTFTFH